MLTPIQENDEHTWNNPHVHISTMRASEAGLPLSIKSTFNAGETGERLCVHIVTLDNPYAMKASRYCTPQFSSCPRSSGGPRRTLTLFP